MTQTVEAPTLEDLRGARVLLVGLGRSGVAAARFLLRAGARVLGYDEDPQVIASKNVVALRRTGLVIPRRPASAAADWAVVSPGIDDLHALVRSLRQRGIPVVDELDMASRFVPGPVIAVTGTNGKSTTTAMIARMLEESGKSVFCGGNLAPGQPLSAALLAGSRDFYVVEASSFQLERARWLKPKVAVVLNIAPDHLNRHRTIRRYADYKLKILDRQDSGDYAVLNRDDPLVYSARNRGAAEKLFFTLRRRRAAACLAGGSLRAGNQEVLPVYRLRLTGTHNIQNCLAAIAAVRALGVGLSPLRRTLKVFTGLPHRIEVVRRLRGVDYINSSMTTNPTAGAWTLKAVAGSSSGRVVLIAGGREKALPTEAYSAAMKKHAWWVLLVGESSARLARELAGLGFHRYESLPNLRAAVAAAAAKAVTGDAVLFAPGFASFDQFRDFEARGDAFRREVDRLG
jgi:UDP-N-acetylmuramoylalanine--D-glutamate ligase